MSNHKQPSVRSLRELAREHLGRGHSRLKTKDELLAALRRAVPQVIERLFGLEDSAAAEAKADGTAAPQPKAPEPKALEPKAQEVPEPRTEGASPVAARPPVEAPIPPPPSAPAQSPRPVPLTEGFFRPAPRKAEPLMEGFFVARVAGERELLRHPLVDADVPFHDALATLNARGEESLGELPAAYDDDQVVLLVRDPRTLYFFWNFGPALARVGAFGARLWVKVFEGQAQVREEELEPGSPGFYLHDLRPGGTYRVECYVRGGEGRVSPLRAVSNEVQLPADGPSDNLDVEVMRVPWSAPLAASAPVRARPQGEWIDVAPQGLPSSQSPLREAAEAAPDWSRGEHLELPSSQSWRGGSGRR